MTDLKDRILQAAEFDEPIYDRSSHHLRIGAKCENIRLAPLITFLAECVESAEHVETQFKYHGASLDKMRASLTKLQAYLGEKK